MAKMETSTKKAAMPASNILGASITGPRIRSRDVFTMSEKPLAVMTPLEKMELVMEGVSKKELEQLKDITEMDYDRLAKALSVTRATLINKKGKEKTADGGKCYKINRFHCRTWWSFVLDFKFTTIDKYLPNYKQILTV